MKKIALEKLGFSFYKCLFFIIPFPFFYDFGNMQLLLVKVEDYSPLDRPSIPMPIGAIALILAILVGYLLHIYNPKKMAVTFRPFQLFLFFSYFIAFFGVYSIFLSGLSVPRFVQVVLPAILLACLNFPRKLEDRVGVLKYYLAGGGFWVILHFLSILLNAENIFSVDDRLEFSSFFGFLVYQALVSYPGVISLFFFLVLSVVFRQFSGSQLSNRKSISYFSLFLMFVLIYIGFAAGRKAFVVEILVSAVLVLFFVFLFSILHKKTTIKNLLLSFLFFVFIGLAFWGYFSTDLSMRLVGSVNQGNFDSGRLDILHRAMNFFYNNPVVLFFGAGGADAPGFHNFFLDQMYRIGIVGVLVAYITTAFLLRKFYKENYIHSVFVYARNSFLLIIMSSLFLQSMINASISQPYYLVNLIVVVSLVVFVVFCRGDVQQRQ